MGASRINPFRLEHHFFGTEAEVACDCAHFHKRGLKIKLSRVKNISQKRLSYALSRSIMDRVTTQLRIWPAQVVVAAVTWYNVIEYDNQPNEGGGNK
jgi:hypothetical protein